VERPESKLMASVPLKKGFPRGSASGVYVTKDTVTAMVQGTAHVPDRQVLVGIPEERTTRAGEGEMTNAALGYLHENGAPEANIPARPHLIPGIREAQGKIVEYLRQAAKAAMDDNDALAERALHAAGITAVSSIQRVLQAGVPPPLADSTLRRRARRKAGKGHRINKGAAAELAARAAGATAGTANAKPLIDTAQLLRSYTHVLREK
jgi:hypothetical protein